MTTKEVRNWLGIYVLGLTAFLGGYAFIAPDYLLPIESNDRLAAFEIILPVLIAQVTAVFRFDWSGSSTTKSTRLNMPAWTVKLPPILVTILLTIELSLFAFAGLTRSAPPSAEALKGLITFCVTLLNATTVYVVGRY